MTAPSRRALLASVASAGTAALAGCTDSLLASRDAEGALSYELSLDRIEGALADRVLWEPADSDDPWDRARDDAVRAAAAGERPTAYGYEPVPDDQYVEREGTYYALDVVTTGLERTERSVLTLSWEGDLDELTDPPAYVRHEELPRLDRHAVKPAYFAARAEEFGGGAPRDLVEEGGHVYRYLDYGTSELVPESEHEYVAFNGTLLGISVEQRTLAEPAHTGVRIPVADSRESFERAVDADLVDARVDADDLSEAERLILARERHEETTPLSEEYRSVIERLGLRRLLDADPDRVPESENGQHLAYDGSHYRYGLYVNPAD